MTDPNGNAVGSQVTHQKARTKLAKRLRGQGVPEAEIAAQVDRLRRRQRALRRGHTGAELQEDYDRWYAENRAVDPARPERLQEETYARLSPPDSGFRPAAADPLLRGAGRATGEAARAVKRGRTVTLFEHRQAAEG